METRGHYQSVLADTEQGIPSASVEGESPQVGEEPNRHRDRMTKAMNKDRRNRDQVVRDK